MAKKRAVKVGTGHFVMLKEDWPPVGFRRTVRGADGEVVRVLKFTPGEPVELCEQDFAAVEKDIGPALLLVEESALTAPKVVKVTEAKGAGVPEPIGPQQLETAAKAALSMVKTIVESLPIKYETGLKSDINVIDKWFQSAGEDYTTFERIRNPERLPWPGMGLGTYHVAAPSSKAVDHFHELCRAMARICESYKWQGLSDGSRIPHSMQRFGTALIPEVDVSDVRSVAIAAQGLVEDLNPTDIDGRRWVEKLESRPVKLVAMTEQELHDMLKAKFDQINSPQAASDLKTVCFDAAETQWTAQKQFESLHLFDAPRCALTEPQLANEWFKLDSLGWSRNLPYNTVVEADARDQLERLRASLVEMLRFLKPRVADVSRLQIESVRAQDVLKPNSPPTSANRYSPILDKREFIKLRKRNGILENSDSEITRAKAELHAIEEPGSNWRRFRIPLTDLRARMWNYPSEWDTPAS